MRSSRNTPGGSGTHLPPGATAGEKPCSRLTAFMALMPGPKRRRRRFDYPLTTDRFSSFGISRDPDNENRTVPELPSGTGGIFICTEKGYARLVIFGAWVVMAQWVCSVCDYVYNEEVGDPAAGISPGTPFENLPVDWRCPGCSVGKEAFVRVDEEEEVETNEEDYL